MDSLFTHFIICRQNDNNKPPLTLSLLLKTPILINKPPLIPSPFPSIPQYPNSKEEVEVDDIGGLELRDVNIENAEGGIFMVDEQVEEKLDLDTEQEQQGPVIIPGLDVKREEGSIGNRENDDDDDDWDSDSEDDLQIVLNNDDGHMGGMGMMDRNNNEGMGSDDEDGEDLVIVANGDHQQQTNEEQEWRDDATREAMEKGRKQARTGKPMEEWLVLVGRGSGTIIICTIPTILSSRLHLNSVLLWHIIFVYIMVEVDSELSATVVPGGAIVGPGGAPGQVCPPINVGPIGGRGRGDWRLTGLKVSPGMQNPFHSAWPNTSAGRGFGSGFKFTLPSHKTVFDIDIESFEYKPWRHPGADLSNFFNFELKEENWKDYCKQLEQLRLEATMQSKIRVYESGRSEQDYDPDLPPELAAAAGIQDPSAENPHLPKSDGEPSDLTGQGRGASRTRQLIDSGDDDALATSDADNDVQRDDLKDSEEDIAQAEDFDRLPQPYKSRKEMVGRREPMGSEGDEVLPSPPEAPFKYNPGSKESAPQEGRLAVGLQVNMKVSMYQSLDTQAPVILANRGCHPLLHSPRRLERWTSNKDRDEFANSLSTSKAKESGKKNNDLSSIVSEQPDDQIVAVGSVEDEHPVGEEGSGHDLEMKDAGTKPLPGIRQVESDKVGDDRHLDTVANLKKRSERFKTPMPTEKDTRATCSEKKVDRVAKHNDIL
ncbi:hypothetical protein IFM89_018579 [Coptis chinensis]|uniref:Pre-mRNA polyadenylation factor Fip1 domain-containing protein n=1 Tax=Coptis chinensis TaxID=261450 RepID=A0A835ICN7_9MAGN|nr:hypothetical protein IFM89_018579 [Coptis chinensis]